MSRIPEILLVLHHGHRPIDGGREQAAQRIRRRVALAVLPDDGRCVLAPLAVLLQLPDFGRLADAIGVVTLDVQGPLDRHFPEAEGCVVEDSALLGPLEREKCVADAGDFLFSEFAVPLAEVPAERSAPLRGVDQLHLVSAVLGLAVGQAALSNGPRNPMTTRAIPFELGRDARQQDAHRRAPLLAVEDAKSVQNACSAGFREGEESAAMTSGLGLVSNDRQQIVDQSLDVGLSPVVPALPARNDILDISIDQLQEIHALALHGRNIDRGNG